MQADNKQGAKPNKKPDNRDAIMSIVLIVIFLIFTYRIVRMVKLFSFGEEAPKSNVSKQKRAYFEQCAQQFQYHINRVNAGISNFSREMQIRMSNFSTGFKTENPVKTKSPE
ncbi:MAG: hypothetical protein WC546_06050 [Candidatus Omnitrophota bacterium]